MEPMRRGLAILLTLGVLACACAAVAQAGPVPSLERQRITATFGRTWLPSYVPTGYIFTQWRSEPGSASAYGDRLIVSFGRHGDLLQWSVENTRDPHSASRYDCKMT